jgi:hypothetical protein
VRREVVERRHPAVRPDRVDPLWVAVTLSVEADRAAEVLAERADGLQISAVLVEIACGLYKKGTVDHTQYDTTAVLRLISKRSSCRCSPASPPATRHWS